MYIYIYIYISKTHRSPSRLSDYKTHGDGGCGCDDKTLFICNKNYKLISRGLHGTLLTSIQMLIEAELMFPVRN